MESNFSIVCIPYSKKTQKARRIEQQLRAIETGKQKRKITKKQIQRMMDRGTQWNKNREKKIYDRKIEIDKKEKEACTFRPEINEISKVLFQKSNGRLCKDLQSPRINYFELMRIGSPRGKSERRKDQGSICDETNINLMLKCGQHFAGFNNSKVNLHQQDPERCIIDSHNFYTIDDEHLETGNEIEPHEKQLTRISSIPVDELINAKLDCVDLRQNIKPKSDSFTKTMRTNKCLFIVKDN